MSPLSFCGASPSKGQTYARNSESFVYDGLNRLTGSSLSIAGSAPDNRWPERNIRYDLNGSLLHLERYQSDPTVPKTALDFTCSGSRRSGYHYDGSGNLIFDPLRSFEIKYNLLNLAWLVRWSDPEDVGGEGETLSMDVFYSDGTRAGVISDSDSWKSRYIGSLIYTGEYGGEQLSGVVTSDGFISYDPDSDVCQMQYFLRDHLGSVRVIAADRYTYLPYGVRMTGNGLNEGSGRNSYFGFSGKENAIWDLRWQDDEIGSHWLKGERYQHFGARAYDPVTCTFMQIDPMAEKYYGMTPYLYCAGNPVMYVEPDGEFFFADGVSESFKNTFAATVKYMNRKGTSDGLRKLQDSKQVYYIAEVTTRSSYFSTKDGKKTIYWNRSSIVSSDDDVWKSPATSLDHEVAHAVHYDINPQEFVMDLKTTDSDYGNKEDRSVIENREQSTARKHGEIRNGQVTRSNHNGKRVPGNVSDKSPEEIEKIVRFQNELL